MNPMEHRNIRHIGERTVEATLDGTQCPMLRNYGLWMMGCSQAAEGFQFVRYTWQYSQILACTEGEGEVLVNGRYVPCKAGQVYITPPGVLHAYRASPGKTWKVAWTIFMPTSEAVTVPCPILAEGDATGLQSAILGIHQEILHGRSPVVATAWLDLILLQARRLIEGPRRQRHLDDIWQEVGQDPAFAWNLDELAHLAGIGPERLRRLCQRQYGNTPMGMVTTLRMRKAADLLAQGQPVRDVANQVGYSNGSAFSTAFRRQFGQAPSTSQRRTLVAASA